MKSKMQALFEMLPLSFPPRKTPENMYKETVHLSVNSVKQQKTTWLLISKENNQ